MKTKTTTTILSIALLSITLTACGSTEETTPAPATTESAPVVTEVEEPAAPAPEEEPTPEEPQVFENAGLPTVTLTPDAAPTIDVEAAGVVRDVSDLTVVTLIEGDGAAVAAGDSVTIQYHGVLLADGAFVDGSYDHEPAYFEIGTGQLIQGWDEGLVGARTGSTVLLVIPSEMAYGDVEIEGAIPANSDLVFVVEVLEVH